MNKIYYSDISNINDDIDFSSFVEIRKQYVDKITDKKQKKQSVAVWKLLEFAIAKNFPNVNVEFLYNDGRFYAKDNILYFSLTHSHNVVAVCVGKTLCGIDVESVSDKILKLEKKFTNEIVNYDKLSEADKKLSLTKLWTEKEAKFKSNNCRMVCSNVIENEYVLTLSSNDLEYSIEKIEL